MCKSDLPNLGPGLLSPTLSLTLSPTLSLPLSLNLTMCPNLPISPP